MGSASQRYLYAKKIDADPERSFWRGIVCFHAEVIIQPDENDRSVPCEEDPFCR